MTATPMMAQYLGIKSGYPDALLFYRMGDFYELFFEDARAAAEALGIALTHRGQHEGADIPMAGVPVHSAEGYLATLIRAGFRVAVCEQTEDPAEAKRRGGSKAVVRREVVRILTPGTLTEDALLDARASNYLAAFAEIRGDGALAWADVSTGALTVAPCPPARLAAELARLRPREVLVAEGTEHEMEAQAAEVGAALATLPRGEFDSAGAARRLSALYGTATLDGFGAFGRAELAAMGAVAAWLEATGGAARPRLKRPVRESEGASMRIDAATRRSLEIARGPEGGRAGSLLEAVDRTRTAMGARLLERRLSAPSRDLAEIAHRLDAVERLEDDGRLCDGLRETLRGVPDIERALSRLAHGRGSPRDLGAIRDGLARGSDLARLAGRAGGPVGEAAGALARPGMVLDRLDTELATEPPTTVEGSVADGVDPELDGARKLQTEGRSLVAAMQVRYAAETGIAALKLRHNAVLGYFVEVTARHAERMMAPPLSDAFIHRQTTAQAVRFTTAELSDLESRILGAADTATAIERRIFEDLRAHVVEHAEIVAVAAEALASLDVAAALAALATEEDWCRPTVDASRAFRVEGGRHPVVERALKRSGSGGFVANDCDLSGSAGAPPDVGDGGLDAGVGGACHAAQADRAVDAAPRGDGPARAWLLTGPNMGGKSTFLRQNALIAVLAQAGSFVPARSAHVGLVSQLFSRVGASDDLARGRSTFMVEMVETAAILHQADDRSLVILDEIGRGTATYDGLSIAWACFEHLHEQGARCLFATHYHEMTPLADRLPGAANATLAVREHEGEVVLLHEVRPGAADRSYGVQVARLAGLPRTVVDRARSVLAALEEGSDGKPAAIVDDLPLFSAAPPEVPAPPRRSEVEARLAEIHPDGLTPREALALIYELRELLAEPRGPRPNGAGRPAPRG